jgi:hypothetical protein
MRGKMVSPYAADIRAVRTERPQRVIHKHRVQAREGASHTKVKPRIIEFGIVNVHRLLPAVV